MLTTAKIYVKSFSFPVKLLLWRVEWFAVDLPLATFSKNVAKTLFLVICATPTGFAQNQTFSIPLNSIPRKLLSYLVACPHNLKFLRICYKQDNSVEQEFSVQEAVRGERLRHVANKFGFVTRNFQPCSKKCQKLFHLLSGKARTWA